MLVAPLTAKDIEELELVFSIAQDTITNTLVPVVNVTAGPTVARSVNEVLVVVCAVVTMAVSFAWLTADSNKMNEDVLVA